jgi:integrase
LFAGFLKRHVDICHACWQILDMQSHATNGSRPGPKGRNQFRIVEFTNPSGNTVFRVTGWTLDGERVRQNFASHPEAVSRMQELEIHAANLQTAARPVVTRLTPEQAAEAEAAFNQLDGKPLLDAVRYYLDNYRDPVRKITVADAFERFIAECEARNLRPLTLTNLRGKTKELRDTYGKRNVSEIGADTLREVIFKPTRGPKARDNYRRAIHGFFEWARKQGYCADNPAAKITPIKADRGEPAILMPEQAAALLDAARTYKGGVVLPYTALALFAGLRPTELARLAWERINLKSRTITIGSDVAKMRGKRLVEISDNLREWLSPFAVAKPPIVGPNFRRDFDAVKATAGFGGRSHKSKSGELQPWTQDILRHSAISYHLARCQHEGKTATWAGNSPDMIQRHYKGLVTQAQARRFWKIEPPSNRKILQLATTKAA